MSYHAQKTTGQRSTGLIVVVVLHIVLIYGLASGLVNNATKKVAEVLNAEVTDEAPPEVELPPPPPPDIAPPPPDFVPPSLIDFVPDAPAAANAIKAVERTQAKVEVNSTITRAKVPPKGFPEPEYPSASKRLAEEGTTLLNLYIGENGKVEQALVTTSSGFEKLDEAATKHALRSWKFIPCMQGDKPVACWQATKLKWQLKLEK